MEKIIKEILLKIGLQKKILNTLIIIIQALIKSKTPSIRQMADFLPNIWKSNIFIRHTQYET